MKAVVRFGVALALTLLTRAGFATESLTEAEVIRRARAAYPLVEAARRDVDVARGDLQAAEGAFDTALRGRGTVLPLGGYPQARADVVTEVPTTLWGSTFFAGYRWGSDGVAPYDGKLVTNEWGEVRAGVAAPLWRNGPTDRRRTQIERAALGLDAGARSVEQAELDAARLGAARYWTWVGAALRRDVVEALVVRASVRATDVDERASRGDLPDNDRVDAQRSLAQRRQLLVSAERALDQATIDLSLVLRGPDGAPLLVPRSRAPRTMPSFTPVPADTSDAAADVLRRRPDLARLSLQRAQQEAEARWNDNQLAPAVDLAVVGSQDLGPGSSKRAPFELEVGLTVDVPIDTDAAEGRLRAARAGAAKLAWTRALAVDQVRADLRDARGAVLAATERERLATVERGLADESLAAERERLRLGESTVFMVDLREQAALEAAIRQIDAAVDVRRASVQWRASAGLLR